MTEIIFANNQFKTMQILHIWKKGGARGVMVIVVRNGHGATSSNPGRDCISHSANILGKGMKSNYSPSSYG